MDNGSEGTLIISGFFARGNAGDEAMLQCIYEEFVTRYRITISVDEHGAFPGFRDWYPYNMVEVIHQCDYGFFENLKDGVGFLVGGGGLSMGFSATHAFAARSKEMPTGLVGVDLWAPSDPPSHQRDALKVWLEMFDVIAPRTDTSTAIARRLGINALHGADWALRLRVDESPEVLDEPRRALVVLREDSTDAVTPHYVTEIEKMLTSISSAGYAPHFLPFSPEDLNWLTVTGLQDRAPIVNNWWNASRLKQFIASSGLTVSVGRLHPCIFGAQTGRIVVNIPPPHWGTYDAMAKVRETSKELGIQYFHDIPSFLFDLKRNRLRPADETLVREACARLDDVCEALHGLFRRRRFPKRKTFLPKQGTSLKRRMRLFARSAFKK